MHASGHKGYITTRKNTTGVADKLQPQKSIDPVIRATSRAYGNMPRSL